MPTPAPISEAERADLRRLYVAASRGRWEAHILREGHVHLYAVAPDGGRWLLAMPNRGADALLMAASRNALPRLFAEIDDLRTRGVAVLGTVT